MCNDVPGIFAVGDLRKKFANQIVVAAADGCIAALASAHYVEMKKSTDQNISTFEKEAVGALFSPLTVCWNMNLQLIFILVYFIGIVICLFQIRRSLNIAQ